jgi:enoyl-CoA hydratase
MEVITERRGPIVQLTLNRPARLNAVDEPLYTALLQAIAGADADRGVRALVLTGAGRAFCVGADLKGHADHERDAAARRHYVDLGQRAAAAVMTCRCPVIAAVNGHAIGAGLELALACDLSVVAAEAKLRFPELGLGTMVAGGTTSTLPQRVGATKARELLLLGEFFSGSDAQQLGICNRAVAAADVLPQALAWAQALVRKAPRSVAQCKLLLRQHHGAALDAVLAGEAAALLAGMETRDWREGVDAFAARRDPEFTGD